MVALRTLSLASPENENQMVLLTLKVARLDFLFFSFENVILLSLLGIKIP